MRFRMTQIVRVPIVLALAALSAHPLAQAAEQEWWLDGSMRLIQTNLREIDARDFDVDVYAAKIKEFGANTVLINAGGIVANYPTELEFHYRNPNLRFDMIGEVVERLHAEGIRVIGRFDFSKINEQFAARNPDWLYKGVKGNQVNYNGQVHTCVNGGYQQEYLFRILGEAIDRYPLDGVFFNMIGYQTRDYSGNYHGICQSDACRRRFREWSAGLDLPVKEDSNDPVFIKYQEFKRQTSDELFHRVHDFIKAKRPDIAICTYTDAGVDLIRRESGSHIDDGHPAYNYHSTDNVKRALGSYRDKQIANAAVHFVAIAFRHSSVAPYLRRMRLVETRLSGAPLDVYMIGRLDNQDDRLALHSVRDLFRFHQRHERWFTNVHSNAEALLVKGSNGEFRGLLQLLAENHIVFDAMEAGLIGAGEPPRPLEDYKLVILPDAANLSDAACQRLDRYVEGGGAVLATGFTSTRDELGNPLRRFRLKAAGVSETFKVHEKAHATYLRIFPKDKLMLRTGPFDDLDILHLYGDFLEFEPRPGALPMLGFIPPAMYGPPEKCYYETITEIPGLVANRHGQGRFAYIPWRIGEQYLGRAHHGHAMLAMAAIKDVLGFRQSIEVEAHPLVEVFRMESDGGDYGWVGLANHSGQIGMAFHEPAPMADIAVRLKPEKPVRTIRLLRSAQGLPPGAIQREASGWIRFSVPRLADFEVAVLEYEQ